MKPDCQIITGDCRSVLAELPGKSAHMCVTSPPYWGLRKYEGVEPSVWGGDFSVDNAEDLGKECQHEWGDGIQRKGITGGTNQGDKADNPAGCTYQPSEGSASVFCRRCSAWRGLLGLEPTIDLYVAHIVECFRAVRRVLRDDGTLWLNISDKRNAACTEWLGMPHDVRKALQADGWLYADEVVWHKPNPMPESVSGSAWVPHKVHIKDDEGKRIRGEDGKLVYTDCPGCKKCTPNDGYVLRWGGGRSTRAHEYLFLLTKKPKYYYDAEAVREPGPTYTRRAGGYTEHHKQGASRFGGKGGFSDSDVTTTGRNKRSVWTIPTEANPEAHFASFPRKLVLPCVLAGTSEKGCCPECGTPWVRVVQRDKHATRPGRHTKKPFGDKHIQNTVSLRERHVTEVKTLGWEPGCTCLSDDTVLLSGEPDDGVRVPFDPVPCTVCDPMCGSGTTGIVATQQGRNFIGIDASETYANMARRRIADPEPEPEIPDVDGQLTMFEEATA